jgi:ATP-dependent helicase/nuclease subunit A
MELTPAQRLAVNSDKKEILVSASAGSGKTHVMTERILRLVLEGAPIESMVICTFTKAAAAELRSRLYAKLKAAAEKSGEAAAALYSLPASEISTIDSFCLRLVKNYFYYTDIDPNIESADEAVTSPLLALSVSEAIDKAFSDPGPEFLELCEILSPRRREKALNGIIERLYRFASITPDPYGWLMRAKENTFEGIDYGDILTGCAEPLPDAVKTKPHSDALIDLACDAFKIYAAKKRKKLCADFNDIERAAYNILSVPEAAAAINGKYRYLFVDEFQDINPLQDKIFERLGGSKFFVGDVKQSIFGFRLTDPSIFSEKLSVPPDDDRGVISLDVNYRSDVRILSFCDRVFSRLMKKDSGGADYPPFGQNGKGCLNGESLPPPVSGNIVQTEKIPKKEERARGVYSVKEHINAESALSADEAETALILEHIARLKKGAVIKDGIKKAVGYGDIAILLRSFSGFESKLAGALGRAGIPFSIKRRRTGNDVTLKRLICFLKLLDNRRDDVALAAALKSPMGGRFSDAELARIRLNCPRGDFSDAVNEYALKADGGDGLKRKILNFSETLERFCGMKFVLPAAELAGRVCSEFGLFNFAAAEGSERALGDFLNGLLNYDGFSFSEALETAQAEKDGDKDKEESADCGRVRIMTVHAAKGLEFPFVLLPKLAKKFNYGDIRRDYILDGSLGVALKYFDTVKGGAFKTPLYLLAAKKAEKKLLDEELRLLYVAMTRAEYGLYLSAAVPADYEEKKPGEESAFIDFLYPDLAGIAVKKTPGECVAVPVAAVSETAFGVSCSLKAKLEEKALLYADAIKRLGPAPYKITVTALSKSDPDSATVKAADFIAFDEAGAAFGEAYHKLFETVDYSKPLSLGVKEFRKAYVKEGGLISDDTAVRSLEKLKDRINGREFYREQGFVYTDKSGSLVQGVIDLLIDDGCGGYELIDYKTGIISDKRLGMYKRQLEAYADACIKILGVAVTKKSIFSINSAEFIEL